jgi:hypothetical protein
MTVTVVGAQPYEVFQRALAKTLKEKERDRLLARPVFSIDDFINSANTGN